MRWVLLLAAALLALGFLIAGRTENAPTDGAAGSAGAKEPRARQGPPPAPLILTATPGLAAAPVGAPVEAKNDAPTEEPTPRAVSVERARAPSGSFTPLSDLKVPTKEEQAASAARTLLRLEKVTPLRATWNDVPLPDVLRQLSKESGLVLALGLRALARGTKIRVSDPLAQADPPVEPTIRALLDALARKHGFTLAVHERGVLLMQAPDPEEMRLRYYDVRELVGYAWGKAEEIETRDQLSTVFPDLVRGAVGLKKKDDSSKSICRLRHGILIARQTNARLLRISEALDDWRADPKRYKQAYLALISRRHPTVSGAPPRAGSVDPNSADPNSADPTVKRESGK